MRRLALVVLLASQAGCIAFSSYQSAKTMPKGGTSVTGAITSYQIQSEQDHSQTAFEAMASHAVADGVEVGGKVAWFNEDGGSGYNLLVAPKIALIPGVLAFTAPTGALIVSVDEMDGVEGDTEVSWVTMPGVVYGHRFNPNVELATAGKLVYGFDEEDPLDDSNLMFGFNVGVRLIPPGTTFAFMPEIGFLFDEDNFNAGDTGTGDDPFTYIMQIGLSFSYEFLPPQ